jgi:hypothetical protein
MRRRTLLFVFVLLVVSAGTAIASAAGSVKAHRKAPAHAGTSSRTNAHSAAKRTRSRKSSSAAIRTVRSTPKPADSTPTAGTAYEVGYRDGYDAGRVAALKELQAQQTIQPPAQTKDQQFKEPPEANSLIAPRSAAQTAQNKPDSLHQPHESDATDEADDESRIETAKLDLPRAGTPISLRGSLASLQRQNSRIESDHLERILDDDDLNGRIAHGLLTPLPASANLTVNPGLPENRRYCRSWTASFLSDLAKEHAAAFHRPFQVNSAVRTVEYQKRLKRTNGNAAAAEGEVVSPHLTGATIDIGKQGMSRAELLWMRRQLLALQNAGKIDVEEEFEQACFHITVYKSYTSERPVPKPAQPALREASAPAKPPSPVHRKMSSLPASIAAGTFTR